MRLMLYPLLTMLALSVAACGFKRDLVLPDKQKKDVVAYTEQQHDTKRKE